MSEQLVPNSNPVRGDPAGSENKSPSLYEKGVKECPAQTSTHCPTPSSSASLSWKVDKPSTTKPRQELSCSKECPNDVEGAADFVPPDGGLVAWLQVLAGLLTNCLSWGYPGTFGVYQLYYKETLQLPAAQISWIGSLQVFLAFTLCTVSGRLSDAGYTRTTVAVGVSLTVLGTLLTGYVAGGSAGDAAESVYWRLVLVQGVVTGVGLGLQFMPAVTVINSYFSPRRRSLALAVAATGTGVGSVVFPSLVQYLVPRVGFAWAVRCQAFVALLMALTALLLLRPRLKPRKSGPWIEWAAFREPPYVLYTAGVFLVFWALYFGFFYINTFARTVIGFSDTASVQLLLILNALTIPSRPFVGFVADRWTGPVNLYVLASLALSGMVFAWTGVSSRAGMYVFAAFFGLANGAAQGIFVGSLASLTTDPRRMGTRFGMVCTIAAFATLAGPPTAGAIIDATPGGKYLYAQIWAGLVIALGAATVAWSRCWKSGLKLMVKM